MNAAVIAGGVRTPRPATSAEGKPSVTHMAHRDGMVEAQLNAVSLQLIKHERRAPGDSHQSTQVRPDRI